MLLIMKQNKIIINNRQLKLLKESIDIENIILPEFIKNSIDSYKTSLGKQDSFPPEKNVKFEEKILKKRYYELFSNVKKVDGINGDISKRHLIEILEVMVNKCKNIEKENLPNLEKICFELANDIFNIEFDDINIKCTIKTDIQTDQPIIPDNMLEEFDDVEQMDSLEKEIMKRRLINALILGASVRLSSDLKKSINKIYTIDHRLPEIYFNIIAINEYLSFVKENKPTKDNIVGTVSVDLTSESPSISSEGIIFPVLLYETIKGLMELISSNGLPDNKKDAQYIIEQSDFLLAENWDKRFGVGMWDILTDLIGEEHFYLFPNIFSELVEIPVDHFNKIMREIFAKTKKGKIFIKSLIEDISNVKRFSEIEDVTHNISIEDYYTPEELISDVINETDTTSVGDYSYDAPAFLDKETADHSNMIAKSIQK